LETHCN